MSSPVALAHVKQCLAERPSAMDRCFEDHMALRQSLDQVRTSLDRIPDLMDLVSALNGPHVLDVSVLQDRIECCSA